MGYFARNRLEDFDVFRGSYGNAVVSRPGRDGASVVVALRSADAIEWTHEPAM